MSNVHVRFNYPGSSFSNHNRGHARSQMKATAKRLPRAWADFVSLVIQQSAVGPSGGVNMRNIAVLAFKSQRHHLSATEKKRGGLGSYLAALSFFKSQIRIGGWRERED